VADHEDVRRVLLAPLLACLVALVAAAPASAGGTTDIVVGHADGTFEVRSVPAATVDASVAAAEREPGVAWAEVDSTMHAVGAITPDDPELGREWGLARTRVNEAWDHTTGDPSIVVAVVDTGVDSTHPDLAGAVLPGVDLVGDGRTGDPAGHGTGVAGVIAGRGDNGIGIAGYCWSCTILPVRVLDARGTGSSATIAQGIQWATAHGADIINLSLAGDRSSIAFDVAVAQAVAAGITVVAAAGNQTSARQDLTAPQYPAATPGVIGVVATNESDAPYSWTFRGPWADVTAPGCTRTTAPGAAYDDECGTSFASPAVAGTIALAESAFPDVAPAAIESALYATTAATTPGVAAHGRVDAAALLDSLDATYGTAVTPVRVAGASRTSTAIALSQRSHATAADVVLARSDAYADALGAAGLAGKLGAPVLLTGSASLDPAVAAEIRRLGAGTVWLAGGDAALSPAVADALRGLGVEVRRLAGATRYDTARLIAEQLGSTTAYVVQAADWPSAVAASGLAALTTSPILLVDRTSVPAATSQALARLGTTDVTVVGDASAVSDAVLTGLRAGGRTVTRVAGANRYETSKLVAALAVARGAEARRTWLATGADWPDALAAGPAAAADGGVLLLVDGRSTTTPAVSSWVQALGRLRELVVVGGEASVTTGAVSTLTALLKR
jgi:subtilisin family serine protease